MAPPLPYRTDESMRRSRHRERLLLLLNSLGEAHAGRLARMSGLSASRVTWILCGRLPYYREDLSLVGLGLARELPARRGRAFAITALGRRKARSVAAHHTRRAERRAADAARRHETRRSAEAPAAVTSVENP